MKFNHWDLNFKWENATNIAYFISIILKSKNEVNLVLKFVNSAIIAYISCILNNFNKIIINNTFNFFCIEHKINK